MFAGLRFPLKTAGFLGWTVGLYGLLEAEARISPAHAEPHLIRAWRHRYGRGLCRLFGIDVEPAGPGLAPDLAYSGTDANGLGRIFVMNHRSALDILITLAFLDATLVSRADLAGWPVIGRAARRVGTLFVDRTRKQSGATVVQQMIAAVQAGRGVALYPEGTTFAGDEVRPFQPGAFHVAVKTGAEVVPLGIAYPHDGFAFGDESFGAHMKRVSREPHVPVALEAGEPMRAREGESTEAFRERVHARVQALVDAARARLGNR